METTELSPSYEGQEVFMKDFYIPRLYLSGFIRDFDDIVREEICQMFGGTTIDID